jgi:hypothetical protein
MFDTRSGSVHPPDAEAQSEEASEAAAAPAPSSYSTLCALLEDVAQARADVEAGRRSANSPALQTARGRLLDAMEAYAAALAVRHLPVPRLLRDELRLHRGIRRTPSISPASSFPFGPR